MRHTKGDLTLLETCANPPVLHRRYWQPNDAQQNNHEAIVHHLCIMTLDDRLYLAPIGSNPKRILDVGTSYLRLSRTRPPQIVDLAPGTGTGIWATDIADKFPHAQVIGTDLSPVGPGMQPDNVTFEIDDCCSEWVYPDDHFDFIHIRGLFGSIADWPRLYREAFRHVRPGGYIEQIEWSVHNRSSDGTLSPNAVLARWSHNAIRTGTMTGKTFESVHRRAEANGRHLLILLHYL